MYLYSSRDGDLTMEAVAISQTRESPVVFAVLLLRRGGSRPQSLGDWGNCDQSR